MGSPIAFLDLRTVSFSSGVRVAFEPFHSDVTVCPPASGTFKSDLPYGLSSCSGHFQERSLKNRCMTRASSSRPPVIKSLWSRGGYGLDCGTICFRALQGTVAPSGFKRPKREIHHADALGRSTTKAPGRSTARIPYSEHSRP